MRMPLAWHAALVLGAMLLGGRAAAEPISVEATVERNDVAINQAFVFTITVNGEQNVSPPAIYDLDDFDVSYLGPQTQVSFVNGRISTSVSHRYRVVPLKTGALQLGPFAVEVQGERYETKPVPIRVSDAGTVRRSAPPPPAADGLRLVLAPAKPEVFVGERIDLTVTLLVGNVRVRDLQYPVISADGVTVDKFSQPTEGDQIVDGRRYHAVALRTTMTPIRPGTLDLSASMAMTVATSRRGVDPLFDQFFPGSGKQVEVQSERTPITVLPLPDEGRPADFSGAVGTYDFDLSAKPTAVALGDPITVRLAVSGTGNLAAITPPSVPVDDRFRAYDVHPVKDESAGDARVFEQVVIPRSTDVRELPPVRFSFFDPAARLYRTITRGPIPLAVEAGGAEKPQIVEAEGARTVQPRAEPQPLGRDIVYIKDTAGTFRPRGEHVYTRAWFLLVQLVPIALFAAVALHVRRRERLAADPRLVRFRAAGREARRALAALAGGPAGDGRFYDALFTAVTAYLGAKLDLPPGAIERERVLARLQGNGAAADTRERVEAFFSLVEQARYAPTQVAAAERDTALALATAIVDGLERQRRLDRHLAAAVGLALCAGLAASAYGAAATPQTAFFQGNQAYAEGRYADAIAAYESVRAGGSHSGALEFNLGNAYFKNGQVPQAIASYERAHRLLPRDPDVDANLAYARELAEVPGDVSPLWQRIGFPFAARATGDELAVAASACWWAFWLLLAVRLLAFRARNGLARAAAAAAALYLVIAASFGLRLATTELRASAVVTAPDGATVRFEPSATGTEHFAAAPGTRLDVTEQRDEWLQVRRGDGLRGWVPRDTVDPLD